jgi:alginate O-acetyltransferase complex protein AlgJ
MKTPLYNRLLIALFLLIVGIVPLVQTLVELQGGERPQVIDLFTGWKNQADLRAFEQTMERTSVTARALRPWMQAAQFFGLHEAGEKALVGRDGWLFYAPGVATTTQRPQAGNTSVCEAMAAVIDFRDQLASRGIRLLVMPVPNKESVYPDRLTLRMSNPKEILSSETRAFMEQCKKNSVEVVDLFAAFRDRRRSSPEELYLAQDSHWTPAGLSCAVNTVAARLLENTWLVRGNERYEARPAAVQRYGDLVRMLQSPLIEAHLQPELVHAEQVVRIADHTLYVDDPTSEVLVLGDSFLRQYEQDEPGHAGFVAHLGRALGRPLASIVNDGGALSGVRRRAARV